jgi:hypothetical protein
MVVARPTADLGAANGSVSVVSVGDDGCLDPKSGGPGCDAAETASTRRCDDDHSESTSELTSPSNPQQRGARCRAEREVK